MARSPTAKNPKRKRRRRRPRRPAAGKGVGAAIASPDCFSGLPDDVLLAITSRLTTRNAVSLAVLSRRFRRLPALFPRLDSVSLTQPAFPVPLGAAPPLLLRRLALSPARGVAPSSFRPVLAAAAEHGVSEIAIRLRRRACLPKNVLSIRSLTVLNLDTCAVPRVPVVACALLRTLKLHRVFINQEILTAVLAAAPGLETLEMVFCTGFTGGCTVESSTVRNFLYRPALEQREVTLRTTGLRTITLYTRPKTSKVQLAPAPEIRKAYLHVSKFRANLDFRMRPFLDAGTGLACLTLRGFAMMLLPDEYKDIPKLPIAFQDLRILSVSLDFSCEPEVVFLEKLLESCPSLEQLTISAAENKKEDSSLSFADHKERLAEISCLTESLAQFNFHGFRPQEYQQELVRFLLNGATKLKKMGLQFRPEEESSVRWMLSVRRAPIERRSTLYKHCHLELEYP